MTHLVIILIVMLIRASYMLHKGTIRCLFGHSYVKEDTSSSPAGYCVEYECKTCGTRKTYSESMFG